MADIKIFRVRHMLPVAAVAMAMLSSCSLLGSKSGGEGGGLLGGGGGKVKTDAVLPQDREKIHENASAKAYTSEELGRGVVKGDWAIERVMGQTAVGEKAPFLKFVPSEKRVYGNNGCNFINAGYEYNLADSTLSFSNPISTMMACGMEGITDAQIMQALNSVKYYTWKLEGSEYYLYLYDEAMQPMLELMHQNFEFLNGTWRVTAIDNEAVNVPDMKLVIDVDEGKLHGNTGCNILNGTLETDMDAANSISFQAIATTRMACPDQSYETRLVVALEDASTAKPISANKVIFLNPQGENVLQLERTTDK